MPAAPARPRLAIRARAGCLAATVAVYCCASAFAQPAATAVEYYHAGFDHYFVTHYADEIGLLDSGGFGGVWSRTGQSFQVWTQPAAGTSATCRFFSNAFGPRSSHFYTPYASECTQRKTDPKWTFEAAPFHLKVAATGQCDAGTVPLRRLYNNDRSGAPNHRYATSRAVFDQMRGQGWTPEGNGDDIVFACVPGTLAFAAAGYWRATDTAAGTDLSAVFATDGTFVFMYLAHGEVGVIDGRATSDDRSFAAPGARDFVSEPEPRDFAANVAATFEPRQALSFASAGTRGARTFQLRYAGPAEAPLALASIAGSYAGALTTEEGRTLFTIVLAADGTFSGSGANCFVNGTLRPRTGAPIADVTASIGTTGCGLGNETTAGVLIYDLPLPGYLTLIARTADNDDVLFFWGKR